MGVALLQSGRPDVAIEQFEWVLRAQPDSAEAQRNWGHALEQMGITADAIRHYEAALRIRPDYAEAHTDLGNVLSQQGNMPGALEHHEQALRLKPDFAEAQNNLAWLLAILPAAAGGDPSRAVKLAERACALTSNRVAPYLDTLAAAYAAAYRFDDAIATAQKAIELARTAGQPEMVSEIEAHLKLYRSGQPYRQAAPK
jgi:tetratricopeptide (TPR) repeat protein